MFTLLLSALSACKPDEKPSDDSDVIVANPTLTIEPAGVPQVQINGESIPVQNYTPGSWDVYTEICPDPGDIYHYSSPDGESLTTNTSQIGNNFQTNQSQVMNATDGIENTQDLGVSGVILSTNYVLATPQYAFFTDEGIFEGRNQENFSLQDRAD